jgi:hypothetical protein
MAKKVKAKRKTSRSAKGSDVRVPLHAVVQFVRVLHKQKRAAKFMQSARTSGASIRVPASSVKFLRSFAQRNPPPKGAAARGLDPFPTGDPWKCNC